MAKLSWRGTLVLGLCALVVVGCAEPQPGEEGNAQSMPAELMAPGVAERRGPSDDPGSPEYQLAKRTLARAPREVVTPPPARLAAFSTQVADAIVQDPGCLVSTLPRNDDGSTPRITLPFSINYFGTTYSSLYINNNGNVTFNSPMATYTPFTIGAQTPPIIAPFFADVDTRNSASGVVTFSNAPITFEGRQAFCVNWVNVGYYASHADKLNSFQLLLVDRNDTGAGNFDIVMNHNKLIWETGDASGGSGGFGGTPAGAGFSAGTGDPAAFFQFPGSLAHNGLLDGNAVTGLSRTSHFSDVVGRHIFGVRSGQPVIDERITLAPASATREPGQGHTVTATLINDESAPLPNRPVTFKIVSGPNSSLPPATVNSDAAGQASFSYTGAGGVGQDKIQATFVKSTGAVATSDPAFVNWEITARPPVALCQDVSVPAGNTCGVGASIDNGSHDLDGDLVGCTQSPGPAYGLGTTLVTLTCTDATGLSASCTGTVTVVDESAPSITCPADQAAECVANAATVTLGAATASDNCGVASASNPGTASYPLGVTPVTFTATDSSGNASICTARVTVTDTLPPSVALNGSGSQVLECGVDSYAEAGAAASDQCAGNVSGSISIFGSVNTGSVGVYNLAYTATDPAGHASAPAFRSVAVRDTLAPELALAGSNPQRLECGIDSYAEAGATASDACSGDMSGSISIDSSAVNAGAEGSYQVSYLVSDAHQNAAQALRTVNVEDATAPSITLNGASAITLECGEGSYQEPGAAAADACSGDLSAGIAISGAVNSSQPGTYTLSYDVTDGAGNAAATRTRTVTVTDTAPPEVTVGATAEIWPPNHGMRAFQLSDCASITDGCGGSLDVNAAGTITSIYSDEPEDARGGGDGHTTGDIAITGNASFEIRAERSGHGNGRVYGVSFTVTDASGNTRTATCHFAVPHDQSCAEAVDDGPASGYTVSASSSTALSLAPRR